MHRHRPSVGSTWSESWVNFNGYYLRSLLASGALPPGPVIQSVATDAVQPVFARLMERINQTPGNAQLIAADLFQLVALAVGPTGAGKEAGQPDSMAQLVSEAVAIIWGEGRESITVKELTEEMLVARRTLERAFRKQLAHGIHDEILLCRLERTTQLLRDRSLSIEQVAIESGFGNVRSLRRAFVAARGMSPQAYRNLLLSDPKAA
jgi:AraC-like DNA-binding protein